MPACNIPWAQKHSLTSSSSKIKTYCNMFINMVTADTLTQKIYFLSRRISVHSSHRQRAVKSKTALTPQQRSRCVFEFAKHTVLWLCSVLSNANLMWIHLLTSPFWSGTTISSRKDASVMRERAIQADRRSRSKLLIASEKPFCAAPRSHRAELVGSYTSRKAR
jgi:hypothetical protein